MKNYENAFKKNFKFFVLISAFTFLSFSLHADTKIFYSNPEDQFAIAINPNWKIDVHRITDGTVYIFYNGKGDALSIAVKTPNSMAEALCMVSDGKVTEKMLLEWKKVFNKYAGDIKHDLFLSITTISNNKTLTQHCVFEQKTLKTTLYVASVQHDFLYNEKQYTIGYSSKPTLSIIDAKAAFNKSYLSTFYPMILTFFLS